MYQIGETRTISTVYDECGLYVKIGDESKYLLIPPRRWSVFRSVIEQVTDVLKEVKDRKEVKFTHHIGGGYYISITSPYWCVDVRRFYKKNGELKPTRDGVTLKWREWEMLVEHAGQLTSDTPILTAARPCYESPDHCNQLGAFACAECYPFGVEGM